MCRLYEQLTAVLVWLKLVSTGYALTCCLHELFRIPIAGKVRAVVVMGQAGCVLQQAGGNRPSTGCHANAIAEA